MNTFFENHSRLKSGSANDIAEHVTGPYLKLSSTLITLLLALILAGCGQSSSNPMTEADYIVSKPISVVLKPGETEQVQVTSKIEVAPGFFTSFLLPGEVSKGPRRACINPDPKCRVIDFKAADTATSHYLNILEFDFTGSVFLGDKSTLPFSTFPVSTQTLPPAIRFAAGGTADYDDSRNQYIGEIGFSLAVAADGTIWAWGINEHGQLGSGSFEPVSIPQQVQHTGSFGAVAAGGKHSLAIESDGTVWAWGNNEYGQLGAVTAQVDNPIPVQVSNLQNIIAIAAGDYHSLALGSDGRVWSWGRNNKGQLGDGSRDKKSTPVQLSEPNNIVALDAGDLHSLALSSNGAVWAWGNNSDGQVAGRDSEGFPKQQLTPSMILNLGTISTIAAGEGFSLGLRTDGEIMSWGSNAYGQLGRSTSLPCALVTTRCLIDAHRVTGLDQVLDIAAGARFAIARRNDGSVWAWGDNELGQIAGLPGLQTAGAIPVQGLNNTLSIAAGSAHAIAMSADDACSLGNGRTGGQLMAWGNNIFGARGDGTGVNWLHPTPVVSIGDDSSCSSLNGHRIIVYKAGTGDGTIQSSLPGMTCTGIICWQSAATGTDVTLTATPNASSEFADWSWDCSAQAPSITLTIDSTKVCKIHFNQTATPTPPPPELAACNDGIDNDGDGLVDLNDPGCSSTGDNSEINNTGTSFTLTINITGSGEVFDNNDSSFFCFSEINASCVQTYPANSVASLRGVSFEIEDFAGWSNECDNGVGALASCTVNMNRDRTVSITMQ